MAEVTKEKKERKDLTPEEAEFKAMSLAERRRHIAQVLSRGLVNHRLEIQDPDPDRRYAWVRDRDEDIDKFRALGYRIETEKGESLHPTGDNKRKVGDVILMSISREVHEMIQDVEAEQRDAKLNAGKREYFEKAKQHDVPIIGEEE